MRELQYAPTITPGNYQEFTQSSSRHDEKNVTDWDRTYADLIGNEGLEFLTQHGTGMLLLLPKEYSQFINTQSQEAAELKNKMADELGDNLWFGFALANHWGENAALLAESALQVHTSSPLHSFDNFDSWQNQVIKNAENIKVKNKIGYYIDNAPEERHYTNLKQNTYYVYMRMLNRLIRSLRNGENDPVLRTATELEAVTEQKQALGDFLNTLIYVANQNLEWDIEDVARYNAHKLVHRARYGKGAPTP